MACNWPQARCSSRAKRFRACEGVPCFYGSCSEVYLKKGFDGTGWRPAQPLPVARALAETPFLFLVHPTLTLAEVDRSCGVVGQLLEQGA